MIIHTPPRRARQEVGRDGGVCDMFGPRDGCLEKPMQSNVIAWPIKASECLTQKE